MLVFYDSSPSIVSVNCENVLYGNVALKFADKTESRMK